MLYLLLTGHVYDHAQPQIINKLRRNVPPALQRVVQSLLCDEATKRPAAEFACAQLTAILLKYSKQPIKLERAKAA